MGGPATITKTSSVFSKIGSTIAGDRSNLAIRAGVAMVLLAACSLISLQFNPSVGVEMVPGLVLEIEAEGIQPEVGALQSQVLIAVGDSSQTYILLPPPVPRPGHFIPLQAEYFRKGNVEYSLDLEAWLLEGPS
jgi:hypothetical protein